MKITRYSHLSPVLVQLNIICSFCTIAELSSWDKFFGPRNPKYLLPGPLHNNLWIPDLDQWFSGELVRNINYLASSTESKTVDIEPTHVSLISFRVILMHAGVGGPLV